MEPQVNPRPEFFLVASNPHGEEAETHSGAPEAAHTTEGGVTEGHPGEGHEGGEHHAACVHHPESPEFKDFVTLILDKKVTDVKDCYLSPTWGTRLTFYVFYGLAIVFLILLTKKVTRNMKRIPDRSQGFGELMVGGLQGFFISILGEKYGRRYTPLCGTIFLYILTMNLMGLIPAFKAPTSSINTTASLAIMVFFIVQWHGIRENGFGNYVKHFVGEPLWLAPLLFPLHIIGELAKPMSLALRLFGNISGEDILMASLAALVGVTIGFIKLSIPFQALFFPLALMFSTIQATVFAVLTAVYILLISPHERHDEGHAAEAGH